MLCILLVAIEGPLAYMLHVVQQPIGGTPLNNPLIDFCALLSKSKLHS